MNKSVEACGAGDGYQLSLCIATLGSPQALDALWQSLARLETGLRWELILVINGCARPKLDPASWRSLSCVVRVLHEPRPGKSRALNLALAQAQGELLVFTDDDVLPDERWLDRLAAAAAAHPQVAIFGGRIRARGVVPAWVRDSSNLRQALLSEHDYGEVDGYYPLGHYPIGPNMAVRRAAVASHGARWIESIGPGTTLPVGDESSFLAQISRPDAQDRYYVADAVVHHLVDGRYFPLRRATRRAFQIGLSAGKLSANRPMGRAAARAVALSLPVRIAQRICGLRSTRELICVLARAVGVMIGSRMQSRY
ncbi:MAG: glycosyltransferase [Stagnimonas sp.]|nr:glycosyltransferase [Stagnimonas sp.]